MINSISAGFLCKPHWLLQLDNIMSLRADWNNEIHSSWWNEWQLHSCKSTSCLSKGSILETVNLKQETCCSQVRFGFFSHIVPYLHYERREQFLQLSTHFDFAFRQSKTLCKGFESHEIQHSMLLRFLNQ